MRNSAIILCLLMAYVVNSFGQTDDALYKYWKYRNRFQKGFVARGIDNGCTEYGGFNIPLSVRRGEGGTLDANNKENADKANFLFWGDAVARLAWYTSVLATEYRLLKNAGDPTDAVLLELYQSILAIRRLDYKAEKFASPVQRRYPAGQQIRYYTSPCALSGVQDCTDMEPSSYAVSGTPNCSLNGYMIRDDISTQFVRDHAQDFFPGEKLTYNPSIDDLTGKYDCSYKEDNRSNEQSLDNTVETLMAYSLVKKSCYDANFTYNGTPVDFVGLAKEHTSLIMSRLRASNFIIRLPYTNQVTTRGGLAIPFKEGLESMAAFILDDNSYIPLNPLTWVTWQSMQDQVVFNQVTSSHDYMKGFILEMAAVGNTWTRPTTIWATKECLLPAIDFDCGQCGSYYNSCKWCTWNCGQWVPCSGQSCQECGGADMLCKACQVGCNKWSYIQVPNPLVWENSTDQAVSKLSWSDNLEVYALMNAYLHDRAVYIDRAKLDSYLITAPCGGPSYKSYPRYIPNPNSPGTMMERPDYYGTPGWKTDNIWERPIRAANGIDGSEESSKGEYPGLDYMLYHNLYKLNWQINPSKSANNLMDVVVSGNITSSRNVAADRSITAQNMAVSGNTTTVKFQAGESIAMKGTNSIKYGSTFSAKIAPVICTNPNFRLGDGVVVTATTNPAVATVDPVMSGYNPTARMESKDTLEDNHVSKDIQFVSIAPSPCRTNFQVGIGLSKMNKVTVKLLNMSGASVIDISKGEYSIGTHIFNVDVSGLASGAYICSVTTDEQTEKKMIIKE